MRRLVNIPDLVACEQIVIDTKVIDAITDRANGKIIHHMSDLQILERIDDHCGWTLFNRSAYSGETDDNDTIRCMGSLRNLKVTQDQHPVRTKKTQGLGKWLECRLSCVVTYPK